MNEAPWVSLSGTGILVKEMNSMKRLGLFQGLCLALQLDSEEQGERWERKLSVSRDHGTFCVCLDSFLYQLQAVTKLSKKGQTVNILGFASNIHLCHMFLFICLQLFKCAKLFLNCRQDLVHWSRQTKGSQK